MTEFHIDPANDDGSPDQSPGITTWCVMRLGVKIASTSSPDLAKRMVAFFLKLLEDGIVIDTTNPIVAVFKNGDLSAEVFFDHAELFMIGEKQWKRHVQSGHTLSKAAKQGIQSGNKNK
ncbi:hypothetical protein PspR84_04295 [Pseudomonas sp. R84]|uniref:hypothetical protein n=1 Tax=Pseudomonas sp. R84 TaxID=1573712 RepID=UPI0013200BF2|nr:hypothetical protein [Pseudomonas sp. R84]QHC93878.1 hypothetical protein PspR84_04295 [Pseudomonas sp. R84]